MRNGFRALQRTVLWLLCCVGVSGTAMAAPTLWEVRDAEGGVRAYLFGAIHLCHAACYPLPAAVEAAFARAERTVFELDVSDPSLARTLVKAGRLPEGQTLKTLMPPELYAQLHDASKTVGLPVSQMQSLQPWFASTLLMALAANQAGFTTEAGVDGVLQLRARESGKPVLALETAARQIEALSGGGERAQEAALRQTVGMVTRGEIGDFLSRMVAAWQDGDDAELEALMFEGADRDAVAPLFAALIDVRNREMTDRLETLMAEPGVLFVTVGGGHLVGEQGIPAALAARGWQVVRR
ncbi:TraB/GumN family protein [Denitromonas halophila]|uniref:TraB/GumN family protein n=1 Tax=Denitromonas halophila TaxID=1629404 RepID=A0A557R3N9_9RHOO|nr:TraB/GumN family protein [Denitromonas halophila]TVO59746.1 TraB/GumN family protein [Denitromonas halophila]